jgi:Pyruvate/2-oxoglutarate dehydrogenase complex, dihydrolipoamide acyltransferase (E2) component, and related enzymes
MMENEIILPKENLDMAAADREQATKEMTNKDQGEVNREENLEEKLTTVLEALEKNLEEAIKEGIKTEEIKTEEIKEQPAEVIPGIIKDEEIKESQEISDAPDPRAGKLRATPAARRIAREFKVELQKVTGSGPNGRIETDDVKKLVVIQPGTFEYKSKEPVVIKTNLDNIVGNPKNLFSTPVKLEAIPEKAPRPRKKLKEMNHKIEKVPNPALDFVPFVDEDDERLKAEEAEVVTKISELDFVPFVDLKAEPLREEIIVKPTPMHLLYESEQEDLKRKSRGQQKRKPVQDESKATETSEQVVAEPTPEEKNTECQSSNIQAPELKENQPAHVLLETDEKEVLEPKVTEPEKVKQMVEQKIEPEAAVAIVEKTDEIIESPAEISGATVQELTEEPEVTKDHHKKNAQESTEKNRVRTVRSKAINRYRIKNNEETPVISLTTEIDMTEIKELRKKITKKIEEQARYRCTYTDFLLLATSRALVTHPLINARREDDAVVAHAHVNMGLTVEAEHGFIVPVIPNTQSMSFVEIVKSRGDLLKAVKNNHLPEDQNSTFTITNLGMYGIREFTAIINQSNSAILSVGEVVQRIRIHQGEPVVRSVMKISLNLDQRVANGVDGAKFLRDIKADMENPSLLLF